MKLRKLVSALLCAGSLCLTSSVWAAAKIDLIPHVHDVNRKTGVATLYENGTTKKEEFKDAKKYKVSQTLLGKVGNYNVYLDIPEWVSKQHTKTSTVENPKFHDVDFSYELKSPDEGLLVQLYPRTFSVYLKKLTEMGILEDFNNINDGELWFGLHMTFYQMMDETNAEKFAGKLKKSTLAPYVLDNQPCGLSQYYKDAAVKQEPAPDAVILRGETKGDYWMLTYSFHDLTEAQREELLASLLTVKVEKLE